jgi:hypothetical protein
MDIPYFTCPQPFVIIGKSCVIKGSWPSIYFALRSRNVAWFLSSYALYQRKKGFWANTYCQADSHRHSARLHTWGHPRLFSSPEDMLKFSRLGEIRWNVFKNARMCIPHSLTMWVDVSGTENNIFDLRIPLFFPQLRSFWRIHYWDHSEEPCGVVCVSYLPKDVLE